MNSALLTDIYQISLTHSYWKADKHLDRAVFEVFFRNYPFEEQFLIFCGLNECLEYVRNFSFRDEDIEFL